MIEAVILILAFVILFSAGCDFVGDLWDETPPWVATIATVLFGAGTLALLFFIL